MRPADQWVVGLLEAAPHTLAWKGTSLASGRALPKSSLKEAGAGQQLRFRV